jgi:hypothetical protein
MDEMVGELPRILHGARDEGARQQWLAEVVEAAAIERFQREHANRPPERVMSIRRVLRHCADGVLDDPEVGGLIGVTDFACGLGLVPSLAGEGSRMQPPPVA